MEAVIVLHKVDDTDYHRVAEQEEKGQLCQQLRENVLVFHLGGVKSASE